MDNITPLNTERLLQLADFLDALPEKKFNYRYIVSGPDKPRKELDCGSVACAIGWCPVLWPELVGYYPSAGLNDYTVGPLEAFFEESSFFATGRVLFGLTHKETLGLFQPYDQDFIEQESLSSYASPNEVSALIRSFVSRGERYYFK